MEISILYFSLGSVAGAAESIRPFAETDPTFEAELSSFLSSVSLISKAPPPLSI